MADVIVTFPGPPVEQYRTAETIAALRALSSSDLVDNINIFVEGATAQADGGGGNYYWDAASLAADDGSNVIKPSDKTSLQAGRWLIIQPAVARSLPVSVKDFGAVGDCTFVSDTNTLTGTDDTAGIQAAITALAAQGGGKLIFPSGGYKISAPITFAGDTATGEANIHLVFEGDACLYAADGFVGDMMIRVGTATGADIITERTNFWSISGSKICHGRQKVATGIQVTRGRFGSIKAQVIGCTAKGIWVGSSAAVASGDVTIESGTKAWWWDADVLAPSQLNPASIGVYLDNCADCLLGDISVIGYRTGFKIEASSVKATGSLHPWTYTDFYGPMSCGLDVTGSLNYFADVYVDSPTSGGDGAITPIYGLNFGGFGNTIDNLVVYLNEAGGAIDNQVIGVNWPQASSRNEIKVRNFITNDAGLRFASYAAGSDPSTDATTNGPSHKDDFRVVDTTKRFNYLGGRPYVVTTTITFDDDLTINGDADFIGATTFRAQLRRRGAAGTNRLISFSADSIDRIQLGLNTGDNFGINRLSALGAFVDTPFLIRDSDGRVYLGHSGGSGVRVRINSDTTTVAPAAGGGGALPATPAGYVSINIEGTDRKIPYY